MKAFFTSDLHLDLFHKENNDSFINSLPEAELLICLGDYHNKSSEEFFNFIGRVEHKYQKIIYVLGNHDYWGRTLTTGHYKFNPKKRGKLVFLNNKPYVHNGVTFFGGTLWYKHLSVSGNWCDEQRVHDYQDIPKHNQLFKNRLSNIKSDNLVVLSHHLPSMNSVVEEYKDEWSNQFFVDSDCEHIISKLKPKLWLHGHTHERIDYTLGNTRVMANPRGYENEHQPEYYTEMLSFGLINI